MKHIHAWAARIAATIGEKPVEEMSEEQKTAVAIIAGVPYHIAEVLPGMSKIVTGQCGIVRINGELKVFQSRLQGETITFSTPPVPPALYPAVAPPVPPVPAGNPHR